MAKNLKDVANQYAKAIFDLSSDHQIVDETLADLRAIKAVLADSPDLPPWSKFYARFGL